MAASFDRSEHTARIVDMGDDRMLGVCEDGRRIWLEGAVVPGDVVRFQEEGKGGRVTELLQGADNRIDPPCPWFVACPGCALQPLPYERQLELKGSRVVESLRRMAGLEEIPFAGIRGAHAELGTRNKLDFTLEGSRMGYRGRDGSLVEVGDCLLGDKRLREWIPVLRSWLQAHPEHGLHRCLLRTDGSRSGVWMLFRGTLTEPERTYWHQQVQEAPGLNGVGLQPDWKSPWEVIGGDLRIPFRLADEDHVAEADAFFQVNDSLADTLVRSVMHRLDMGPVGNLMDLFCGTGAFTLPASKRAGRVLGLDTRPGKGPFRKADLRRGLPPKVLRDTWQTVLTDPPRSGMEKHLVRQLLEQVRPQRILYISCNPATLARDLKRLMATGAYRLIHVEAFDLFPQTPHVETVCELERVT